MGSLSIGDGEEGGIGKLKYDQFANYCTKTQYKTGEINLSIISMWIQEFTCFAGGPGGGNPALVVEDGPSVLEERLGLARERALTCVFLDPADAPGTAATLDFAYRTARLERMPTQRLPLKGEAIPMIRKIIAALLAAMSLPVQSAPLLFDNVASIVRADAKTAFAGLRANTYIPDASVIDTVDKFIGIPGSDTPALSGPYAMIDGCRHQSCIEKAAVIVNMRSRTIAAVALRNYECRHVVLDDNDIAAMVRSSSKRPAVHCNTEPILDVYVVRRSSTLDALRAEREQLAQLRQWGDTVGHQGERVQVVVRHPLR